MKRAFLVVLISITALSCNRRTPEEKIGNLNGYWQIKSVEPEDGQITEFGFSEVIDYIHIDGTEGLRKKVRPQLDGNFTSSEGVEAFSVKVENDSIHLYYETAYDSWKETLISSEEEEIKMLNPRGTIYTYKRFTPYMSEENGKEK